MGGGEREVSNHEGFTYTKGIRQCKRIIEAYTGLIDLIIEISHF